MIDIEKLKEPFPAKDIQWRVQRSGKSARGPWAVVLAYVDARAIMDRLDEVVGPMMWNDDYEHLKDGVVCRLSIDGVTKMDGAPETAVEAFKGGISKAFVRAAVKWGIGRYLYNLKETYANCSTEKREGWNYAKTKDGVFYWETPTLPSWALPATKKAASKEVKKSAAENVEKMNKEELLEVFKGVIKKMTNNFSDTERVRIIYREMGVQGWKELSALKLEELKELYVGFLRT